MTDFFKMISDEINHEYEPGIGAEIRSFIEYQEENIKESIVSFEKESEIFILKIETNDMDVLQKKQLFKKLVRFLEFPYATFYTVEQNEKALHFRLVSYTKKNIGFVLDVELH